MSENPETKNCCCSGRRSFLVKLSLAASSVAALAVGIPGLGFFVSPFLRKKPEVWRSLGDVRQFKVGETVEVTFEDPSSLPWAGVLAKTAAWLRRDSETEFTAYAVNCSHLGCPVRWIQSADLFLCPCHGGVYDKNGDVAGGPPPRPLTRYQVRTTNGEVQLLTRSLPIG